MSSFITNAGGGALGRRPGFLADRERAHVQAAVHELGLDGREREAVALQRFDDAVLEGSLVGMTDER